jgi:hypothetical protein
MNKSKLFAILFYLALIGMVFIGYSCAANHHVTYFEQGSIDNNDEYYKNVSNHFIKIGNNKTAEEIKQYTAAIFIASIPPVLEVYEETELMGKTNLGLLYFKPGNHKLVIKSSKENWTEDITLIIGRNKSILFKKR